MSLYIQKEGILTTIQDLGRRGFDRFGINRNGVMDRTAARLINTILGNNDDEAVLEMHYPAPEIVFEQELYFAVGGADFAAKIDENPIRMWQVIKSEKGSVLKFSNKKFGCRCYLAVKGGFQLEKWLGSSSTNLLANIGGFKGRKLQKDDRIFVRTPVNVEKAVAGQSISNTLIPFYSAFPTVRVTAGPEFDSLTVRGKYAFLNEHFIVSNESNRMGYRLGGEALEREHSNEIISASVTFGTIQLPPDGHPIVLMADHQTSGGYARIAAVVSYDLPLLAQLGAGDKIAFKLVAIDDAERLAMNFERELNILKIGCKYASTK